MPGDRARAAIPAVVAVGIAIVLVVVALNPQGVLGGIEPTGCSLGRALGNETVWMPGAVIAAPCLGTEYGTVVLWGKSPYLSGTASQPTRVGSGNVTAFWVDYDNITIYSLVHGVGAGRPLPCLHGMVSVFSPNPSEDSNSGGVVWWPVASNLTSDSGLSLGLNASQLCSEVENVSNPTCGVSATFDLNFETASGTVDTCGRPTGETISLKSLAWPESVPFSWKGVQYEIPLYPDGGSNPSFSNGTYAGYNYTFPANGGIWKYDNLADTSATGAGLVFSYSRCPESN